MASADAPAAAPPPLSSSGRMLILVCAFLGWLFAGVMMATTQQISRPAAEDLLTRAGELEESKFQESQTPESQADSTSPGESAAEGDTESALEAWRKGLIGQWFAWYQCAFLFGAATGGLVFGRLGDRFGRKTAMAASIMTYSGMAGLAYFVQTPGQLLVMWFLACTGIGGMWPNGVALVSEAWAGLSRPVVAGLIGTAANIGIFLLSTVASWKAVVPDDWRWVLLIDAGPLLLGVFSLIAVPESPRWLAERDRVKEAIAAPQSTWEVFRPPLLQITLVGILLATIPLLGGWGSANWMIPWADEAGVAAEPPNPYLKAQVGQARSFTGVIGSLIGGWVASMVGRRRMYFLNSLICLFIAQWTFRYIVPTDGSFLFWVAGLGFFSGLYFGWLPLCLPELFQTRVRSTGAGVSFNFGRILTAVTIFASGALMTYFEGDFAAIGRLTSWCFALGMLAILFAPDTTHSTLDD